MNTLSFLVGTHRRGVRIGHPRRKTTDGSSNRPYRASRQNSCKADYTSKDGLIPEPFFPDNKKGSLVREPFKKAV